MAKDDNDKKMSVEEAGRKGGEKTAETHDKEFYEEIGKKDGEARADQDTSGTDKMSQSEAGKKGGEARAKQRKDND
ncbi:MAG TPA: stress-induced protein, KGG, repeat-containing protein [Pseudogracilibacillus sp.]|nr:stress-induced protein, KGG, repeat-containing protein [Pseudogracilibacillus sp.]